MPGAQTSDVDSTIHQLADNPSVIGFVILNNEGIPVRHHEKMPYEKAIHYSCLISDFYLKSRRALKELFSGPDVRYSCKFKYVFRAIFQTSG